MPKISEVFGSAAAIAKGMSITLGEMMNPTITEDYPDTPPKFQERYRGVHVLQRDENGLEKCVACFLCAAACPSNCIYIEAADNTPENRICCAYCVEACPTDAITHGHGFEVAALNASSLVYRKEQMLAPRPALQGENAVFSISVEEQLKAERERGGVGR